MPEALNLLEDLIRKAKAAGADAADAVLFDSASLSLSQRLGKPEKLERSESGDLGLRVFVGQRQAIVSSTDRSARALEELVERAIAMARVVPEDQYAGLADPDQLARDWPDLDTCDPEEPAADALIEQARIAEEAAMAVPGVTNSEGADAGWSRSVVCIAASNGFAGSYSVSRRSLSASVLAGTGTGMERDYDFDSKVYGGDLRSPEAIGREAGERAVRRLNPRKVKTQRVPVVYDPRASRGLLGHLTGAISGPSVARGTSFLKDRMGQRIFAEGISIVDDPFVRRGLRSRPFDAEGVAVQKRTIIEDGVLTTWLLDLRSARQLGLSTTGHASRGTSGPPGPSPSNVYLAAGRRSRDELIADIDQGLYVVELMGMGVNGVTGDYSRGASGFWIENGTITHPVSELTVAGNLKDMFLNMEPASDLELRFGMDAPTIRIEGMTIAGT
ncbi:TldD/PmbA family protein [Azospirillum sp. RWY-5-1]|uniref:TldD/PmbA family protein n=1 Tax=Azospirillum oleiclasticum TaxID=2735135 RepID=A0ABX2T5C0_9PROT|nr:metallopeptidase TldD-related protein [Azospirillum oleiclasticum]NYZ12354.1 TldD/PmbA family protein [Azospirillum oleiclasticum]NYZ19514.1 TldD/PmbA family protein [Azospirillum oleiclasticum]